jgi:hypothetical protein
VRGDRLSSSFDSPFIQKVVPRPNSIYIYYLKHKCQQQTKYPRWCRKGYNDLPARQEESSAGPLDGSDLFLHNRFVISSKDQLSSVELDILGQAIPARLADESNVPTGQTSGERPSSRRFGEGSASWIISLTLRQTNRQGQLHCMEKSRPRLRVPPAWIRVLEDNSAYRLGITRG